MIYNQSYCISINTCRILQFYDLILPILILPLIDPKQHLNSNNLARSHMPTCQVDGCWFILGLLYICHTSMLYISNNTYYIVYIVTQNKRGLLWFNSIMIDPKGCWKPFEQIYYHYTGMHWKGKAVYRYTRIDTTN